MDDQVILEVKDIAISFGGLQALIDVSFSAMSSKILGLIGPNGAGKTVLLNCINGVYIPDRGRIVFNGMETNGLPRHKAARLGMARTFQQIELFEQMSVIENTLVGLDFRAKTGIFSGGMFWGPGKREEIRARQEAEEVLDFLELYPYRKQRVGNLSFGIQKLVGLARAMAMEPKILLLDEIASGLNREEKEDLVRFLLRIRHEKKIPMIWVEHDMEIITQIADRLVCLNYGVKLAEGTPKEVISNPDVIKAYLGT
ncbi:MAG: ABC transporter ATP-binding protein [Deltaproteobacteria bacterium]|nr:ABC transporter ATP-binding protein [Deltaproteobacteria bacterium]